MEAGGKGDNTFNSGNQKEEDGSNKEGDARHSSDSDAIQVLQCTDSFFVADTVEDDDSMMIPPTPDMIIPSTQEFTFEEEKNTTVLSVDETCTEDLSKPAQEIINLEEEEEDPANDMTQDLPELDVTQQLLSKNTSVKKVVDDQEDDDWQLRFTETQETQELLSISRMREAKEKELSDSSAKDSTENKDTEASPQKQISPDKIHSKPESISPLKLQGNLSGVDPESEDEIEPSQSCLIDYQTSSTYSAFRDEVLQSSLSTQRSTTAPESQASGKIDKPSLDKSSDIILISDLPKSPAKLNLPSPKSKIDQIKNKPLQIIDIDSENEIKELKPKTDSDIMEITASGKIVDEPLLTKVDTWVVGMKEETAKEVVSLGSKSSKSALMSSSKAEKSELISQISDAKDTVDLDSSNDISISELGDPKPKHSTTPDLKNTSKDTTISDLGDPKDITMSDLGDPKIFVTPDHKNISKDTTISDLGDPKDITMSDLGDPKDSTLPDDKDRTLHNLEGSKDRTLSDSGGHKLDTDHSKDESVSNPVEQGKITTVQKDVLRLSAGTTPDTKKSDQEKITPIISSDNQFKSVISELSFECASAVEVPISTSTPCEGKDSVVTTKPQELKVVLTGIKPVTPNKGSETSNCASDENGRVDYDTPKGLQSIKMVEPPPQTLKSILHQTSRLSRNKQKVQFENGQELNKGVKFIGSFDNKLSLKKIFNSVGLNLDKKQSDQIVSLKSKEEVKISKIFSFTVREKNVYLEESLQFEYPGMHLATSPHSSSGSGSLTATSSSISIVGSLHSHSSADMGDIDSSSTSKSANSSRSQLDSTVHNAPSQEEKTSTQKSEPSSFSTFFDTKKEKGEESESKTEPAISPITSTSKAQKKTTVRGRKRTVANSSSSSSTENSKKRGRYAKKESDAREEVPSELEKQSVTSEETKAPKTTRGGRRRALDKTPASEPALKIEVQEISPEQEINDGSPVGNIIPGVRVMARWTDGFYYPGVVQSKAKEDRWSVCFDDGTVKAINHESLIKASYIQPGTSILVQNPESYFDSGIVRGLFREGNKVGYEIELDNGTTKKYPRKSVVFSSDQAKLIMSSRPPTTPATMTINLDNIVGGKRKRKSLQSPDEPPTVKKPSRTTRREAAKVDTHVDISAIESTETSSTEEPETSKSSKRITRKRKAAVTAVKKTKLTTQRKNSKLFKDYAFILTKTERKIVPPKFCESDCTEDEEIKPYDKEKLVSLILPRGGTVLDQFDDIKKCSKPHIYLLANTYLRTMKYIQCLASGIACIKHHWGEILSERDYVLPAGMSIISNIVVEWHGKTDVLKDKKISLVSTPGNPFVDNWTPLLLAAKVDVIEKFLPTSKSGASANIDLIITNSVCPQEIIQAARRKKIPVASIEWVIQSLIAGKCLPYDAHPKFKHDYTE
ncbi:protein hsr-9 isoform X2 [Parasteatoda tepidariorum]|uniref:protein hsr-9 isoform X2 n=1 Tax=Parasteatoda tepidariorum TaxID=114398 RepID=UPI001C724D34|nr:uncharacterized protein LOC107440869 isoform X2 [Parasteatoda tepidariorum]